MRNWPMIKVADEFDLQMGKTPARDNPAYWGGEQKWASIADIARSGMYLSDTKEAITQEAVSESGIKAVPQNTVVMSFKLSLGRTAITASRMYTNEAIMAFLPHDATAFDLHFLYHLFSNRNWSEGCNKAVKGVTLNKATLNAARIPKPDISEQRAVASTLDKICALMAKCDEQIVRLDQLVKSRFVEMFGDGSISIGRWDDVFIATTGKLDSNVAKEDGQYPFFTCAKTPLKIDQYAFDCEALLLAGNNAAGVYDVKHYKGKFNAYQRTYVLRLTDDRWEYAVFKAQLESKLAKMQAASKGTMTKYLTLGILKKLDFIVPPLALQREFAAFVEKVDKLAFAARQRREVAKQLYRAKIQEFFG